jgi:hypothetical protein
VFLSRVGVTFIERRPSMGILFFMCFALSSIVHKQAASNQAYNIFNFAMLGFLKDFYFIL